MRKLSIVCTYVFALFILTGCHKNDSSILLDKPAVTSFNLADSNVVINPFGYTPLSAQITFTSATSGQTFIRVHGKHGAFSDVVHLFSDYGIHTILFQLSVCMPIR